MAYNPILLSEVDAKSPIDQALMSNKIKNDFDDHEARILALEGGGGGSSAANDPRYGTITAGLQTNEAQFWRKKYNMFQTFLSGGYDKNNLAFDPDGLDKSRWMGFEAPYTSSGFDAFNNNDTYANDYVALPQSRKFSFKLKRGENFFGLGYIPDSSTSSVVRILVNGQALSTYGGITDDNGTTQPDSFSSVGGTNVLQNVIWFFGFKGDRENIITVFNDDPGSATLYLDFIEIGYATPKSEFANDHTLNIKAGKVNVRGVSTSVNEQSVSFTPSIGYGHTGALVCDTSGAVTALNGVEPAMTVALPDINIPFSSGPVSSIKVRNSFFFPSSGFLLLNTPWGLQSYASYTSKTEASIGQHSFNGMQWQSSPTEDFNPLANFGTDTGGDSAADLVFNLWAAGGHVISSSNNKLDFKVTLNGTQTTHTATIPNGLYSADIVPLGEAVVKAMSSVKPLANGDYFCEYNSESQLWSIGIKGNEISELQLLFLSGSNTASSIHTTLGFSTTDKSGSVSYVAQNQKQSLAHRVFRAATDYMKPTHPRYQFSSAAGNEADFEKYMHDAASRSGFGLIYRLTGNTHFRIYPDDDATGLMISFLANGNSGVITAAIDNGGQFFVLQPDNRDIDSDSKKAQFLNTFISFPRGSRVITIYLQDYDCFSQAATTGAMYFVGSKQYYTKPREEALTSTQAIIKCFDIAPRQLFKTYYGVNYSPQATKDNIDTITYTGSWTSSAANEEFNGYYTYTQSNGDYVDVTFTTQKDGGGISFITSLYNNAVNRCVVYLVSGATGSETNSKVQKTRLRTDQYGGQGHSFENITLMGLPAGQYTCRVKNEDPNASLAMIITAIAIIDGIEPDAASVVSDLANTGQSVTFPINTIKHNMGLDGLDKVPYWLSRSGYNEGNSVADIGFTSGGYSYDSQDDSTVLETGYYFGYFSANSDQAYFRSFRFCKSLHTLDFTFSTYQTQMNPVLDGRNPNSKYSQRVNTKGGSAPSATRNQILPLYARHLREFLSANMSSSTVCPISNTRGFKVGDTVILEANSQPTLKRTIASIVTDTSITFSQAVTGFSNYTTANNASVKNYGFHSLKVELDVNSQSGIMSALCFEPLDISPSKHEERRNAASKKGEIATITFYYLANNQDLYYPFYSDGVQATPDESVIQLLSLYPADAQFKLSTNLKNVFIAGTTPQIHVKITSIRS